MYVSWAIHCKCDVWYSVWALPWIGDDDGLVLLPGRCSSGYRQGAAWYRTSRTGERRSFQMLALKYGRDETGKDG